MPRKKVPDLTLEWYEKKNREFDENEKIASKFKGQFTKKQREEIKRFLGR